MVYTVNTPATGVSSVSAPCVGFGYTENAAAAPLACTPGLAAVIVNVRVLVVVPQPLVRSYETTTLPVATPVIYPVAASIEAIEGSALVHVPPDWLAVNVCVAVTDIVVVPVMVAADGKVFTVTTIVRLHVFVPVYVMVGVPLLTPVTTPVDEPTVALAVLLLAHVPPDVVFAKTVDEPAHTTDAPAIAVGKGFTTAMAVA